MVKHIIAFTLLPYLAFAQESSLPQVTIRKLEPQAIGETNENLSQPQQVYVVNNAAPVQTQQQPLQVQTQPVTVVEDTPLRESRAEQLRKSRIQVEQETEEKIVEKLESERLRAEQERAEKIMSTLEQQPTPAPTPTPAPVVIEAAPQMVVPVAPVAVESEVLATPVDQPVVVKEEASVSSDFEKIKKEEKKDESHFFISGGAGVGSYPGADNVTGIYATGVSVGIQYDSGLIVEGSFGYSTYDVEEGSYGGYYYGAYPVVTEMNQMNFVGALKYALLKGKFRPVVGGLLSYTRRDFVTSDYFSSSPEITSHAFDMGASIGADLALSEKLSVGVDFKYLTNISHRMDREYSLTYLDNRPNPIEEFDYYTITVGAKLLF